MKLPTKERVYDKAIKPTAVWLSVGALGVAIAFSATIFGRGVKELLDKDPVAAPNPKTEILQRGRVAGRVGGMLLPRAVTATTDCRPGRDSDHSTNRGTPVSQAEVVEITPFQTGTRIVYAGINQVKGEAYSGEYDVMNLGWALRHNPQDDTYSFYHFYVQAAEATRKPGDAHPVGEMVGRWLGTYTTDKLGTNGVHTSDRTTAVSVNAYLDRETNKPIAYLDVRCLHE